MRCYKNDDDGFTCLAGEILDPTDIIDEVEAKRNNFTDLGRHIKVVYKPGLLVCYFFGC